MWCEVLSAITKKLLENYRKQMSGIQGLFLNDRRKIMGLRKVGIDTSVPKIAVLLA